MKITKTFLLVYRAGRLVVLMLLLAIFSTLCSTPATASSAQRASFYSDALGADMEYLIYLPPDYSADEQTRYPVVYLLHGYDFARNQPDLAENMKHEEENHWVQQERIPEIADCLTTVSSYDALMECLTGKEVGFPEAIVGDMKKEYPECPLPLPPMIIVMPDGNSSFYANRLDGLKLWPPLNGPEFVDGIRKGATGQYETYIYRDLVESVDSTYRTIADRDKRGIGGFSMGAIGSMNLLLGHPDVFCSTTSLSGVFTLSDMLDSPLAQGLERTAPEIKLIYSETVDGKTPRINKKYLKRNDPYYRLKNLKRLDVNIYYDAGSGDFFSGMYNFKTFDKFAKGLKKKGLTAEPANHVIPGSDVNGKGMHTGVYWRSRVGVILAFHAKAFGLLVSPDEREK